MTYLTSAWVNMEMLFNARVLPTHKMTSPYSCNIFIISWVAETNEGKLCS